MLRKWLNRAEEELLMNASIPIGYANNFTVVKRTVDVNETDCSLVYGVCAESLTYSHVG